MAFLLGVGSLGLCGITIYSSGIKEVLIECVVTFIIGLIYLGFAVRGEAPSEVRLFRKIRDGERDKDNS